MQCWQRGKQEEGGEMCVVSGVMVDGVMETAEQHHLLINGVMKIKFILIYRKQLKTRQLTIGKGYIPRKKTKTRIHCKVGRM